MESHAGSAAAHFRLRLSDRCTRAATAGRRPASQRGYLETVRGDLANFQIVDRELEQLAAEALGLEGPWQALIAPPRR